MFPPAQPCEQILLLTFDPSHSQGSVGNVVEIWVVSGTGAPRPFIGDACNGRPFVWSEGGQEGSVDLLTFIRSPLMALQTDGKTMWEWKEMWESSHDQDWGPTWDKITL